ncbi:hypothetical protein [Desulfovibrio sp. DV]|uniref:hypothetical protein n=1 Tax=Desulfovibrio sp. DV TaxID=1844708 RepID=UPI0020C98610|nr:hypothetical protein [Desulfovibrio sp. DV]
MAVGSGCAPTPAAITVHQAYTRCPRPTAPELPPLDPEQRLETPANINLLLERDDRRCAYAEQQDAALDCYEGQAKPGGQ